MTNKLLTLTLGISAISTSVSAQESSTKSESPLNILFIMCDDHSYQTISAYDTRFTQTPNIDRIANEGVRFTNSFVANSISGPSRACMLTGKHSHINGYTDNVKSHFDGGQETFPKLLQTAGYQTAVVGKWHLTSNPTGFDYWNILIGQGEYYNPTFINNGTKEQHNGYATNITTDIAIDWMDNKRDKDKPFCLLLHHKAPHRTWQPDTLDLDLFSDAEFPLPDNFYDNYEGREAAAAQEMSIVKDMDLIYDLKLADKENEIKTGQLGAYGREIPKRMNKEQRAAWDAHYDKVIADFKSANLTGNELAEWKYRQYMRDYLRVIASVDRNIGEVLNYLEENGLLENTIIVYTSDQGFYMGEHGWFDKRFMYEESFRTPLLVRMPDGKKGDIKQLVQNIDYAPTLLDIAGVEIPEEIHGASLLPLLKGDKCADWRESLYYHYYEFPSEHSVKKHYGVRTDRYKLIHFYDDIDTWELYDLKKDPNEMNNLYGKKGHDKITAKLKIELAKLRKQYNVPADNIPVIEK